MVTSSHSLFFVSCRFGKSDSFSSPLPPGRIVFVLLSLSGVDFLDPLSLLGLSTVQQQRCWETPRELALGQVASAQPGAALCEAEAWRASWAVDSPHSGPVCSWPSPQVTSGREPCVLGCGSHPEARHRSGVGGCQLMSCDRSSQERGNPEAGMWLDSA